MDGANEPSRLFQALLYGIIPDALYPSGMYWSAILLANCGRRHSCAPISKPIQSTYSAGSFVAGPSR